jgi:hypothetical protein
VRNLAAEGQIEVGCAGLLTGSSEPRVSVPDSADGGVRPARSRDTVCESTARAPARKIPGYKRFSGSLSAIRLWLGPVVQLPHLTVVLEIRK